MTRSWDIEQLSKADLIRLLDERNFWAQTELPFSRLRAQQYIANPFAEDADPLWLLVRYNGELIGYIGMIPDKLVLEDKQQKFCWLSSVWVAKAWRSKGLGSYLLEEAGKHYPHHCVNSGTRVSIGILLSKKMMVEYAKRERTWYIFGPNTALAENFKLNSPLFKIVIPVLRWKCNILLKLRLRGRGASAMRVEYLNSLDKESKDFLAPLMSNDLSFKDIAAIYWRTHNTVNYPRLKGVRSLYSTYFGNLGYEQHSYLLKLKLRDRVLGLVNLVISDGILKLPYFYLLEEGEAEFGKWLCDVLVNNRIDAIYTQNPQLNAILQRLDLPVLFKKNYAMSILISPSLTKLAPGRIVQDGDGAF